MITLKDSTTPSTSAPVAVVVNNCVYTPSHYQFLAQFKEETSYSPVSFLPNPCAMLPSNQDATVTSTTASREDFGEYQPSLHIPYSFMAPMSSSGENATIDIESEIVTTNQPSTSMNNNHHLNIDNNQPNFEETNIFHDFTSTTTTTTTTLRNRQQNHVDMQSPQSFHHSDINRAATNTFQKVPPQPPDQQQQQQPPPQTMDLSNLSILYPLSGVDGLLPVDHDHVDHLISFLKGDGFNPNNTMDGRMTNNNNMELLVQANMSSINDHSKMSFKNMLVGGHEAATCNIDTTPSYMHDTCINNEQQQQPTPLVQDNNNAFTPHFAFRKRKNTKRKSISSSPSSYSSNSLDEDTQHVKHADLILDDEDISNDQFASDLQDQDDHSHSPTSIRNKSSTGNTIGAKAYPNGRKRASKACLECQKRHTRCGFERPCDRCTKLGLNCVEVVSTKKRGRSTANMNNKHKLSEETLDLAPSRKKEKTSSRAPNQTASPSSNESNIENVNNASGSRIIEKQSESSNPNEASSSSSIPNGSEQVLNFGNNGTKKRNKSNSNTTTSRKRTNPKKDPDSATSSQTNSKSSSSSSLTGIHQAETMNTTTTTASRTTSPTTAQAHSMPQPHHQKPPQQQQQHKLLPRVSSSSSFGTLLHPIPSNVSSISSSSTTSSHSPINYLNNNAPVTAASSYASQQPYSSNDLTQLQFPTLPSASYEQTGFIMTGPNFPNIRCVSEGLLSRLGYQTSSQLTSLTQIFSLDFVNSELIQLNQDIKARATILQQVQGGADLLRQGHLRIQKEGITNVRTIMGMEQLKFKMFHSFREDQPASLEAVYVFLFWH